MPVETTPGSPRWVSPGEDQRATRRVLLVDDDPDLRETVATWLERRGHEVYPAGCADEACAVARAWPPDAAVLDLLVPGHVEAAARALREAGIPVVLASGSSQRYLADAARRLGAAAIVPKPYGLAELLATLSAVRPGDDAGEPFRPSRRAWQLGQDERIAG